MRYSRLLIIGILVISCGENTFQNHGNVFFKKGQSVCTEIKNHWLLDIKAQNFEDSIYLDTRQLGMKIEIHRLNTDTTSAFIQLLGSTCKGDSIYFKIRAYDFYTALKGTVPTYLNDSDYVFATLWMRDKLGDLEHIAYKKAFESNQIDKFINNQRWNGIRDSSTLIYYEKLKSNINQSPKYSKAKIKYVLKKINGQVIYYTKSHDPFIFDPSDEGVIGGIRFLASKLSKGESLRAIVPSDFAYGDSGNHVISGYTPVIIEMELLEYVL